MRVDEHTIELAGSPVFFLRAGAPQTPEPDTPQVPALYLHGIPTSSADFRPFLERTGGIAPDLIGFGRSAKGGNLEYTLESLAEFVRSLLAELGIGRVRLVGHGWGGAAGLVLAQRRPELIERIVLINALPLLEGFAWPRVSRIWRRPILGELVMGSTGRRLLARTIRHGSLRDDAWPDDRIATIWEQFDQGTQRAILRLHRSAVETDLVTAGAGLTSLRQPTLVIWGQRDPWLGPEFGEAYAARLPEARLEPVAQAGHWPWLDQPGVIDLVATFVE